MCGGVAWGGGGVVRGEWDEGVAKGKDREVLGQQ